MQLQQTSTDTVELETFGPATLCTFNWGGNKKGPVNLVSTSMANMAARKRTRPVDAASKLERLVALTDAGLDVVSRFGVTILFANHRTFDIGYDEKTPLYQCDEAGPIRELLSGLSDEEVYARVYAGYSGVALFKLDSLFAAEPINHPVYFEISNANVRIDEARAHLEAHPLVKVVTYDNGRPGAYDHVPSSLNLVVTLPDAVRSKLEKAAREYYKPIARKSERLAASPSYFTQAFTWYLNTRPKAYGDILGLSKFARKHNEYKAPSDWDEDGDDY